MEHGDGVTALDDVTLTVEPGRLTAVIGPSGAGKSTLLKALAGIAPAQQGTVAFAGATGHGTGVGFVPQDDILHRELPLRRTLRYAAALRFAASPAAIDAAVADAMGILGLDQYGDVPVHSLSGGQGKRASIACEILSRPGVSFLDEPTSGLDPATAADLVSYLHRMCADGSTVVFTTHSVEDIERSDSVVVLAPGGRLLAVGTPSEVLDRLGADTFPDLYGRLSEDGPASNSAPARPRAGMPTGSSIDHRCAGGVAALGGLPRGHAARPLRRAALGRGLGRVRRTADGDALGRRSHSTHAARRGTGVGLARTADERCTGDQHRQRPHRAGTLRQHARRMTPAQRRSGNDPPQRIRRCWQRSA
jgi:ABC-type multidrug transport system ATPase subunit